MSTYKKQLKDKDGNTIYPDVGIDLDNVVYSDDPESVGDDYIDPASYSETEHKTGGTWVDGKPIYKKTIKYQNLPIGETDIPHGISNIGVVIKNESFCKINDTTTLQVPTIASSTQNSLCIWTTYSTTVKVFATLSMDLIYITLYYTKTTD